MIEIRNLAQVNNHDLFTAFSEAFRDYEITLDKNEHERMLRRRGFNPELSFGAFDHGKLVSFTCNGIGTFNNLFTAYDTGTGTLKEYRGQGLASEVFKASIPSLVDAGIRQYLLEVLQHNEAAISVYRKLKFEVSREFNYFVSEASALSIKEKSLHEGYNLRKITLSELNNTESMCDFHSSWQNSCEAIVRSPEAFVISGVFSGNMLVGYGIFEPASGDITQLAVLPECRRKGIATVLFAEMLTLNQHNNIKAINTDTNCKSIGPFFASHGLALKGKQYEMIRTL
ncbi:MAG: hypothetical protein FD170_1911 [Bacteroidetes bacterium]|nr:MAG: hypothetical protein FD170_1911 [Bacteroidota bacterium]